MADVIIGGVVTDAEGGLQLTGTSADVGRNQVWIQVGDEWFKAKVDAETGDWTANISADDLAELTGDETEGLEVSAGVYQHPAHLPGVGAHKLLVEGSTTDTAVLTPADGETANLVANGSFEADAIDAGTWTIAPLTGWTGTDGGAELWNALPDQPAAAEGAQNIELDSDARLDVVSQTLTTVAGETYELSLAYASRTETAGVGDATDSFEVWWNGELVATVDPEGGEWQAFSAEVTATGSDVLELREAGANDGVGALIDDVALVSTAPADGWVLS